MVKGLVLAGWRKQEISVPSGTRGSYIVGMLMTQLHN